MTTADLARPAPTGLWTLPAIVPTGRDAPDVVLGLRMLSNQIAGWPHAVFEDDVWRPRVAGAPLFVTEPQAVKTVMLDRARDFPAGALFRRMMSPAWGRGLLLAAPESWRMQRQACAQAFRPASLALLTPRIAAVAEATLDRWLAAGRPATVEMASEMTRATFDIILDTMLSGGEGFDRTAMQARMTQFFADIGRMRPSYFLAPDAWHSRRPDSDSPLRAPLKAEVRAMVQRRRAAAPRGDLVDLLFAARDPETGDGLDDALIADNLMGFILAGHSTTALGLTWALYILSAHTETARRIRAEVLAVAGDEPITAEHQSGLVFTRQVVQETLRLYPPGYLLTRVSLHDTELAGVKVRAGQRVNIPVYASHRHRKRWEHPDAFDPDRFAPGRPAPDRHVYMPFGAGPRICIGAAFAMLEMVTVLATLARRADFAFAGARPPLPVATLGLDPQGGMPITVSSAG